MKKIWNLLNLNIDEKFSFFSKPQLHRDGFSIPGIGSIRLSNMPKNLNSIAQYLTLLVPLSFLKVSADNCEENSAFSYSNIYLNHTTNKAFLYLKVAVDLSESWINNTCNFTLAAKQPGDYLLQDCACSSKESTEEGPYYYNNALILGQNVTQEMVDCIKDFLNNFCNHKSSTLPVSIIIGIFILACGCWISVGYWKWNRASSRSLDSISLNSPGARIALLSAPFDREASVDLEQSVESSQSSPAGP